MKNTSVSSQSLGAFLSPGAPDFGTDGTIYDKGWSSERVPLPSTAGINGRRHISSASALSTPFYSGRALPSKWEDAERWICSPIATSSVNSQFVEQRKPKSKSGPIVPPTPQPPSSATAAAEIPAKGMTVRGLPFSTGVLEANRVLRGTSVINGCDGWMDLVSESSSSSSKEETKEEAVRNPMISRRDMATQMSPNSSSPNQSPHEPEVSPRNGNLYRQRVKEVKIDRTIKGIPERRVNKMPQLEDLHINWDVSEAAMSHSKLKREEAKITAWENLQKAKAEAAIRKLEVKLEKKKSESIDKILNKLQSAQLKAQNMRSSISNKRGNPLKITHLIRRHTFMNPFMICFAPRVD